MRILRTHKNELFVATRGAVKDWKCIVGGLPVRRQRFSVAGGAPVR